MSDPLVTRPAIDSWQVLSMRLTLFAEAQSLPLDGRSWWKAITGEVPETTTEKARGVIRRDEGKFLGGLFSLDIQAQRITWELVPLLEPAGEYPGFPLLGAYSGVRDPFVRACQRWLGLAPPITRVAFGCQVALPQEDKVETYRMLASFLPFAIDAARVNDFQYRINRRRGSNARPGVEINRFQTWSATTLRMGVGLPEQAPVITAEQWACLLDLDVNTAPEYPDVLPHEVLRPLVHELVDLADEILAHGDQP
jgi:hypothetical protein